MAGRGRPTGLTLSALPWDLAVCRLPAGEWPAAPPEEAGIYAALMGPCGLTLVCREDQVPSRAEKVEPGWAGLVVQGPLPFEMVGVISRLSKCLADENLSVFCLSTYATDYLLVKRADLSRAMAALARAGHRIQTH